MKEYTLNVVFSSLSSLYRYTAEHLVLTSSNVKILIIPLCVFGGSEDLGHVAGLVAADVDLLHRVPLAIDCDNQTIDFIHSV